MSELPEEIAVNLNGLNDNLDKIADTFKGFYKKPLEEITQDMAPLDKAKLDIMAVYSAYSLFWSFLRVKGTDMKDHPVKREMEQVRKCMNRASQVQDMAKAPKLDSSASKRFISGALYERDENKIKKRKES